MKINKNFYLYSPINAKTRLYYASREVLKHKLLLMFSQKTYPHIAVRIRNLNFLQPFFEFILSVNKMVPDDNVFIIYEGHDSTVYFTNKNGNLTIKRLEKDKLKEERFKGYPIHYNFKSAEIENKELIIKILKEHLYNLKNNKSKIHGDFTVFNILVDESKKISIIDPKTNGSKSLLADHFYFYAYFLIRVKRHNPFNKEIRNKMQKDLNDIYKDIFYKENLQLLDEIGKIEQKDLQITISPSYFTELKSKFRENLKRS